MCGELFGFAGYDLYLSTLVLEPLRQDMIDRLYEHCVVLSLSVTLGKFKIMIVVGMLREKIERFRMT